MADHEDQSALMPQNGGANGTIPEDDRKLFIGGLSWETDEAQIKEYFAQFGEIDSVNLKTDSNTGKSRGFAFVLFKTVESLDQAINAGEHTINNKKVDAKKAKAKQGKIFVGGLTPEISDDDIRTHFAQFGNIVQVELPFDKVKNQRKAFCFITYETEAVISDVLRNPKQTISGKEVDVKKAAPKPDANKGWGGVGGGGGFQGAPRRGGGRPPRGGGGGGGRNNYQNQNWNNYNQGGYGGYNQTYGGYDAYANYGGNGGGGGGGYNNYQNFGSGSGYGGGYQNQGNQRNGGGGGRGRQQQRHQPY